MVASIFSEFLFCHAIAPKCIGVTLRAENTVARIAGGRSNT